MNSSAWRRTANRFHYWKWVTFIRYATTYGKTYAPFFHLALGGSLLGMWFHKHSRDTSKRNLMYVDRKANIAHQAEQIELALTPETPVDLSELESAVHRTRKGEFPASLKAFYGMYNHVFGSAGYKILPPAPFSDPKNIDMDAFDALLKEKDSQMTEEQREALATALQGHYKRFSAAQDALLSSKQTEKDVHAFHKAVKESNEELNKTANEIRGLPSSPKVTNTTFGPFLAPNEVPIISDGELKQLVGTTNEQAM